MDQVLRNQQIVKSVKGVLFELEAMIGIIIPIEYIVEAACKKGYSASDIIYAIDKLKLSEQIYEPRKGFYSLI